MADGDKSVGDYAELYANFRGHIDLNPEQFGILQEALAAMIEQMEMAAEFFEETPDSGTAPEVLRSKVKVLKTIEFKRTQ